MPYPLSNIVVVTPPATEPISLAEAHLHLRVDITDDDALITSLIVAAREHVEAVTSRALVTRTLDYYQDQFPGIKPYRSSQVIDLPRAPLQSVISLIYSPVSGSPITWTPNGTDLLNEFGVVNAHLDNVNEPGRISLAYSMTWPNQILKTVNALKIRYTAGYGTAAQVPDNAKVAMKMLMGTWYDNRESIINGRGIVSIPIDDGVDMLLAPLKIWNFA